MIITRKLSISAEDFFKVLEKSIKNDMNNEFILVEKGLTYHKEVTTTLGKVLKAKISLLEYDYPKAYKSQIENSSDINTIYYQVTEISANEIEVLYEESFTSADKSRNLNYKFIMMFMKKRTSKRMNYMLDSIEKIGKDEHNG